MDEESSSKRVDRVEEMTIPSDLEDKLRCATASSFRLILALILALRVQVTYVLSSTFSLNNGSGYV